jgi:transposase
VSAGAENRPVGGADRKRHRTHLFRIVLSHSRKAYAEVTFRQATEDFLRALENASWQFGGVPKTLIIDNLKAAVSRADWFDPEINPKLLSFAQHYGTVILPTRPRAAPHANKSVRYSPRSNARRSCHCRANDSRASTKPGGSSVATGTLR